MCAANDGETQGTFLLLLNGLGGRRCARSGGLGLLALDASELFGIGEDKVHVLVESEHLAGHLAPVVQRDAHPEVDVSGHLALFVGCRHGCGW